MCDGQHHIKAISEAVPGSLHDKKLSDEVQTLQRLPSGCEVDGDKGYQGMEKQAGEMVVKNEETGGEESAPRLRVKTPIKKPKGGELREEEKQYNKELSSIRVRVEHCIGWVKNWGIIGTRFRCSHEIYTSVMRAVCGLVNAQTQRWQQAKLALPA